MCKPTRPGGGKDADGGDRKGRRAQTGACIGICPRGSKPNSPFNKNIFNLLGGFAHLRISKVSFKGQCLTVSNVINYSLT